MMWRAPTSSQRGSIQLPLLFALALFLGLGFRFGDFFREDVVARKAVKIVTDSVVLVKDDAEKKAEKPAKKATKKAEPKE